jgi:hypothetical protein
MQDTINQIVQGFLSGDRAKRLIAETYQPITKSYWIGQGQGRVREQVHCPALLSQGALPALSSPPFAAAGTGRFLLAIYTGASGWAPFETRCTTCANGEKHMPFDEATGKKIRCPFCAAVTCTHLLAVVDLSFSEWWETGYASERHHDFYLLIEDRFRQWLECELQVPPVTNPELAELWKGVVKDFSGASKTSPKKDHAEVVLDNPVVNRLIIELLRKAGADYQRATEGYAPGYDSSMAVLHARNPAAVLSAALEELKRLLS